MESLQLTFKTLPGVGSSYTIVIGSDNNARAACKVLSMEEYERLDKQDKRHKKHKKRRRKKKRDNSILHSATHKQIEIDSIPAEKLEASELEADCDEMSKKIEEGIRLYGENRNAISYAFAEVEKDPELMPPESQRLDNIDSSGNYL